MRASDIVNQIATYLPRLVDDFTINVTGVSLTRSGTTVTVTTSDAHGLDAGNQVNITGAQTPINCSITRSGIVATLVTDADHDMTENAGFNVQIEGATEAEFNGTFDLLTVPNRRTITFLVADSGPVTATGSPLLLNGSSPLQSYNGLKEVSAAPTATTFEYEVADSTLFTPASGSIVIKTLPRISSGVTLERIIAAYTAQLTGKAWLFIVLGDGIADKSRGIDTDATDNVQPGNDFDQRLIQVVQAFVFLPAADEIAARASRDRCEELLQPICQSILTAKFPSLVENNNNPLMITGHGFQFYNSAFYVHQYAFEATLQMGDTDTFKPTDDVAFRDIELDMSFDVGTGAIESDIDLDDEPL